LEDWEIGRNMNKKRIIVVFITVIILFICGMIRMEQGNNSFLIFLMKSLPGAFLFLIFILIADKNVKKIVKYCLLALDIVVILIILSFEVVFSGSKYASNEILLYDLLVLAWPLALGYLIKWLPKNPASKIMQITLILFVTVFIASNFMFSFPAIIQRINLKHHEIKFEKISPQGNYVATVIFDHGASMFSDGETYLNIRSIGDKFRPYNFFKQDFMGCNDANVMILDCYNYVVTDLKWDDEKHLTVMIADYNKLANNKPDDNENYSIVFDKKLDKWKDVVIKYEELKK